MLARMILVLALLGAGMLHAQSAEPAARLDMTGSGASSDWFGKTELTLSLSRGVPFRVFTLDSPPRLVVDFQDLDATTFSADPFLEGQLALADARMGLFAPGWTRFIGDLTGPFAATDIAMRISPGTNSASVQLSLAPVAPEDFAARVGPPPGARWVPRVAGPAVAARQADFVVVIDPGHGGIDPGAQREGVTEKDLVLGLARRLAARIDNLPGAQAVLTRNADVFVSLADRVARAHLADADLFVSLHADALNDGGAEGATVYMLSDEASDAATSQLAARHNRADALAGIDLSHAEGDMAQVLLDLARRETDPRSRVLASTIVSTLQADGVPTNNRPLRQAGFAVLKAADIPSVLVEVGFMSSPRDLANLQDAEWQQRVLDALTRAVLLWQEKDERRAALLGR